MAEYQKILQNGPQLRVAFQDHLVGLSDLFMSVGLISSDNASEVTNQAISTPQRASKMLEFVRNKVKLNRENYRVFVKALQQDVGQYGDILKILGEKGTGPKSNPTTQRLQLQHPGRFVESDVIQQHYADLNLTISENVEVFGVHLVQHGYCTQTAMTNITGTLGLSSYHKASRLLSMVDARIKTSASKENARKMFDYLVLILAHKLSHYNLAQALVDSCSSKDHSYVSPLSSEYNDEYRTGTVQETAQDKAARLVLPSQATPDTEKHEFVFPVTGQGSNGTSDENAMEEGIEQHEHHGSEEAMQVSTESSNASGVQMTSASEYTRPTSAVPESSESKGNSGGGSARVASDSVHVPDIVERDATRERTNPGEMQPVNEPVPPSASPPESTAKSKTVFSKSMPIEQFVQYLKSEGLCERDCQTIKDNGFTAMSFVNDFLEDDITCPDLNFTRAGKRILRRLLNEIR